LDHPGFVGFLVAVFIGTANFMDLVVVNKRLEPRFEAIAAISVVALVVLSIEENTLLHVKIFAAYSAFKCLFFREYRQIRFPDLKWLLTRIMCLLGSSYSLFGIVSFFI